MWEKKKQPTPSGLFFAPDQRAKPPGMRPRQTLSAILTCTAERWAIPYVSQSDSL
jgi:hypothetical protein